MGNRQTHARVGKYISVDKSLNNKRASSGPINNRWKGSYNAYAKCTGGSSSQITIGGKAFTLLTFTSDSTLTVSRAGLLDVYMVGGGGNGWGGDGQVAVGAGGGGGSYRNVQISITAGSHNVDVGGAVSQSILGSSLVVAGNGSSGSGGSGGANTAPSTGPIYSAGRGGAGHGGNGSIDGGIGTYRTTFIGTTDSQGWGGGGAGGRADPAYPNPPQPVGSSSGYGGGGFTGGGSPNTGGGGGGGAQWAPAGGGGTGLIYVRFQND